MPVAGDESLHRRKLVARQQLCSHVVHASEAGDTLGRPTVVARQHDDVIDAKAPQGCDCVRRLGPERVLDGDEATDVPFVPHDDN
jgi:hypothetical protein